MDFSKQLQVINEKGFFDHLKIFRGIEKEALRVNKSGELSKLPHPDGLGSTIIDLDTFEPYRIGIRFQEIRKIAKDKLNIDIGTTIIKP